MAEQKFLTVTVTKVDGPLFDGEAISVVVPGVTGVMEILTGHEALISPLTAGTLKIKKADGTIESHEVEKGTFEISDNHATILI